MSNALARKYRLDVTSDTINLATGWLQVNGLGDFSDDITPNLEDSSAYDTSGWTTREPTMQDAQLTATFMRRLNAGVYDAGQELLRACRGAFGDSARIGARWYDKTGGPEAYQSVFIPTWKRSQTGVKSLEQVTVTFDLSDVPVTPISNPIAGASVPTVTKATPSAQTAGNQVTVFGDNFTGATQVSVGGTVVTVASGKATIVSDDALTFVVPAGSAGSAPIIVTNAAGASAAFTYTRGA